MDTKFCYDTLTLNMNAKPISYKILQEAIRIAFTEDKELPKFYDPNKNLSSIEEIVDDVSGKIKSHDNGELVLMGVYEKNNLIGYFVFKNKLLISFSINVQYRTRHNLRAFFRLMKSELRNGFGAMLWTKNVRAIKWLTKNGMKTVFHNEQVTQLVLI